MESESYAMLDPATDQFLWTCSGPTSQGECTIAHNPPYVCQGLRLVAVRGTASDGSSMVVEQTLPSRCPAVFMAETAPAPVSAS